MSLAVRIIVTGRVQGVWYRGWTIETATARALRGWVRNRRDGSVEALFVGPADAVESMIADCHRGPPAARVESVARHPGSDDGAPGFRQLPTV